MATSADYVSYVMDQASGTGEIRCRKMFGEYMVYVDDKPILLVCDYTVFVKILPVLDDLMADAQRGLPYQGAREHYILDIDDRELTAGVIASLLPVIPLPKPRTSRKSGPSPRGSGGW